MKITIPASNLETLKEKLRQQRRNVHQLEDQGKFTEALKAYDAQLDIIVEIQTTNPNYDFKDV